MGRKILVAYDTMFGSTAEVAQFLGQELAKGGDAVDVRRVSEVSDVSSYQAVIVGGPLRGGKWIEGAIGFLNQNQNALSQRPLALFTVCLAARRGEEGCKTVITQNMAALLAGFPALKPVSVGAFAGVLDFNKYPAPIKEVMQRVMSRENGPTEGRHDFRNWEAVRTWTKEVGGKLK